MMEMSRGCDSATSLEHPCHVYVQKFGCGYWFWCCWCYCYLGHLNEAAVARNARLRVYQTVVVLGRLLGSSWRLGFWIMELFLVVLGLACLSCCCQVMNTDFILVALRSVGCTSDPEGLAASNGLQGDLQTRRL